MSPRIPRIRTTLSDLTAARRRRTAVGISLTNAVVLGVSALGVPAAADENALITGTVSGIQLDPDLGLSAALVFFSGCGTAGPSTVQRGTPTR